MKYTGRIILQPENTITSSHDHPYSQESMQSVAEAEHARLKEEISRLKDELKAERQKGSDPTAAEARWLVMGDFVEDESNLSGLSSDPPPRPLPEPPHGPPNKPLPALKGDRALVAGWSSDRQWTHMRISTEAVATMRGVNTLLAILQARNDAIETKTRTLEDALSERDSRIAVLLQQRVLLCLRAHVACCSPG